ncbi:TPA: hypothetical protein NO555_005355 [Klebsiella variicola subsp. variicola]|nr:hypothetical protein [Klebsiella variicola subsp. variicola]HCI4627470.1 hypothetical protein [Klebsiella variicola subsp. variicola]HCI6660953.1 hypothetical protein [Klebsiella variicola subsp. variicola]
MAETTNSLNTGAGMAMKSYSNKTYVGLLSLSNLTAFSGVIIAGLSTAHILPNLVFENVVPALKSTPFFHEMLVNSLDEISLSPEKLLLAPVKLVGYFGLYVINFALINLFFQSISHGVKNLAIRYRLGQTGYQAYLAINKIKEVKLNEQMKVRAKRNEYKAKRREALQRKYGKKTGPVFLFGLLIGLILS